MGLTHPLIASFKFSTGREELGNQRFYMHAYKGGRYNLQMTREFGFFFSPGLTGWMLLDERTFNRPVRTKYAAIPFFRLDQDSTSLTFVEELASNDRHDFRLGMPAAGASEYRFENGGVHIISSLMERTGISLTWSPRVFCPQLTIKLSNLLCCLTCISDTSVIQLNLAH